MSFITDTLFGGDKAADASTDAADAQVEATEKNIAFQEGALETIRGDLEPFRETGIEALSEVSSLISDPYKQLDFVQDNPFFQFLADDAQRTLFNNEAARGKVGSGGTALALQNANMLLGTDLVNNQVSQLTDIATLGANAAAQTGTQTANTASSIGDSILGAGNAIAAGEVGAANASNAALGTGINTALGAGAIYALSDRNEKTDIKPLGNIGFPVYFFKYKGSTKLEIGGMAQDGVLPTYRIAGKLYVDYGGV